MAKRVLRRIALLLMVFVAAAAGFSYVQARRASRAAAQMAASAGHGSRAGLPTATMRVDGTDINQMEGLVTELQGGALREHLTPLPTDRLLTASFALSRDQIQDLSYQITRIADDKILENGEMTDLQEARAASRETAETARAASQETAETVRAASQPAGGAPVRAEAEGGAVTTATFQVRTDLPSGQEYLLRLALTKNDGQVIYYYTRLVQGGGLRLSGCLAFANRFYQMCLNKNNTEVLTTYLEPDADISYDSYTHVDIHASADVVTWGRLAPQLAMPAVPAVCEVNDTTVSVRMAYLLSATDGGGQQEYYAVTDFYRLKENPSDGSVALLNFDRSASVIFSANAAAQTDSGLDLGVQDRAKLDVLSNADRDIAAFAAGGDVWTYDIGTGEAVRVFSFRRTRADGTPVLSAATESRAHGASIAQVAENGDVTFVVYGYMPRGSHAGQMGLSAFQYTAQTRKTKEQIFIPLNQSFAEIERNVGRLSYIDEKQQLYLFLGTELCRIRLTDGSYDVVQDKTDADHFFVSESQHTVAWTAENGATVLDLTEGARREVTAPEGERLVGCGFVGEAFVYGFARQETIVQDAAGTETAGLYRLQVEGADGVVQKTYERKDLYVTAAAQEAKGLSLTLSKLQDGAFAAAGTDHMMSGGGDKADVSVTQVVYERTGRKTLLVFPDAISWTEMRRRDAGVEEVPRGAETVLEWPLPQQRAYYVYGEGALACVYTQPNLAILRANELGGVVLNEAQQYVWERGVWGDTYRIDTTKLPQGVLSAPLDAQALQEALGEDWAVLNLTGLPRDCLYYQIAKGYAVLAAGDNGQVLRVVGYDPYNIWVFEEKTGKQKAIATDDADALFRKNGWRFLSYRKAK